jgi:hypothetical protein
MRVLLLAIWLGSLGMTPALAQDAAQIPPTPAPKTAPAPSRPRPSTLDLKLAETIVYYYVKKDPSTLFAVFSALREPGVLRRTGLSRASLAGFLSMVFIQNRSRLEGWIGDGSSYPPDAKSVLVFALWQSGNADLVYPLFREQPNFANDKPGNLYTLTPRSAVEMDLKWGAFFATGNPGFVAAMADALDVGKPLTGSRELDTAIRSTSVEGLTLNMPQHEVLERYIRQRDAEASGPYKRTLDAILASRKAALKPAPDHDGDFSGAIATLKLPDNVPANTAVIDKADAANGPQTARRGDTIGVTVLFSGMQLADDLSADVSYDIKVTGPDGTVDPRSAQSSVAALKEKVPARFNVIDSRSTLSIHFEPDDKLGSYRIDVLLRDNIGEKKLALSRSIELVDK